MGLMSALKERYGARAEEASVYSPTHQESSDLSEFERIFLNNPDVTHSDVALSILVIQLSDSTGFIPEVVEKILDAHFERGSKRVVVDDERVAAVYAAASEVRDAVYCNLSVEEIQPHHIDDDGVIHLPVAHRFKRY